MKILKAGKGDVATCPNCESELRYKATDIGREYISPGGYDFEGSYNYNIICAVCGCKIPVNPSGMMKAEVDKNRKEEELYMDL